MKHGRHLAVIPAVGMNLWTLLWALVASAVATAVQGPGRPPEQDRRVTLDILEGQPSGTVVGSIPVKSNFTYRFNEPPREFVLDPHTGEIRTTAVLDREGLRNDRYDLVVLSSQPTYPIEVRIVVLDVNDNAPEFPEPSIAVAFSESAVAGTRLLLDAATDKDLGRNGVSDDYHIVDGNQDGKFRLEVTANPSGGSYLHLETTGKLDRENKAFYQLNISARDDGEPVRYGYLKVNVTILDVNDNPPIFTQSDYSASLNESVPPGTYVLQVMASDTDVAENAKITYYLADSDRQFAVDPETGDITTTTFLDCPPQQSCLQLVQRPGSYCPKSCVFTVFARDHGSPRQDGRTYVTVSLVDNNDHDPTILFSYFSSTTGFATVDENASNGSLVAAVSVVDQDEGLNGETTLTITAGNEMKHFRLVSQSDIHFVYVNGVLDREQINKYNLTVVATDKGTPQRTATAFLIVHVNDVNDHEPVFTKSEYSAVLSELAPPGSYVAGITATDEDTGVNAQIFYDFVSGNDLEWFHIDSNSGLTTTKAPLDREVRGTVELNISARDGGPNPKWAYTQLKVTILDENDERPRFNPDVINVSLSESTPPRTLIAMLKADDNDQGTNGSVTYNLMSDVEHSYPGTFALDLITGQLTTKKLLDREKIADYEIRVIARDQGSPQQSSTAVVHLSVLDVNDNDPEFQPQKYFKHIKSDVPVGTSLLQVTATDADTAENATVRYTLESGDEGVFEIDPDTGVISLKSTFINSKYLYHLRVSAKDGGGRKAAEDATVEIVRNDHLPVLEFESTRGYEFEIAEDDGMKQAELSRRVGLVKVRVGDVRYSIVSGDARSAFKINERTGEISTANTIDRELTASYNLTVTARSGLAFGQTSVRISVLDVNDNEPSFGRDRDEVRLAENTAVGEEVHIARAVDKDAGVNSQVLYNLSSNPHDQFRIVETTGVIYLNRPLRVEPGTVLHLEVNASDAGQPSLWTVQAISVVVEDVNDHTPVFDHTLYETSLLESTPVNHRFFQLSASDSDLGANGQWSYRIIDGNADEKFDIFPDGFLYVRSALDREDRDYYSLTVTVTDHGDPPRSSMVPLVIHVLDDNDNAPEFSNATFNFVIRENEPPDSFVGKLIATDNDIGRNAEITFSLTNMWNDFTVDPRNGFMKTLHFFDREEVVRTTGQNFITLEAIVSDNGVVRLRDKAKVNVFISDVNDNPPKFTRSSYKVQVSEGAAVGDVVVRVYTTDADEGPNGDVVYSLVSGDHKKQFAIDELQGIITVARPLDRETTAHYQLVVLAQDKGTPIRLNASAVVSIDVLDENDNAPQFTQSESAISVVESTAPNIALMQFHATDADLGLNSEVTFSITAGNRRDSFRIDAATGTLYLHRALDFEDLSWYALNITASDGGNAHLSTTIPFRINVLDSNDNAPSFPNTAIVRQIREGISVNEPIVTVTAEDPDSGANGRIVYSIVAQEPLEMKQHFAINPHTGVIFMKLPIDRETVDTFKLTVRATDQAEPPERRLSAEKLVTVLVDDANDNAPVFVSMSAVLLPTSGDFVMTVQAHDADSGSNGLVTYDLVSGDRDLFSLQRATGALTLRRPLPSPLYRYELAVKASDEAVQSERLSTDTYISVLAPGSPAPGIPVPQFSGGSKSASVSENMPAGTSILAVSASLPGRPSAKIEMFVTNVTACGGGPQAPRLFAIDPKLGVLITAAPLDREAGPSCYDVEVLAAVSNGNEPLTSKTKVSPIAINQNLRSNIQRFLGNTL